ncbi:MAG: YcaO-like family protein [Labilithrix sp.]|nr:YcaO-like family protein [Labilithrix sp.]MCW5814779.1 YcaO-like family protein [Labilithrix sp.]
MGDTIDVDGWTVHRSGVSAVGPTGEEICGSAAARGRPATERAWFELVERVSAVQAIAEGEASYPLRDETGAIVGQLDRADVFPANPEPERWVYARSNGVAIHSGWRAACERAVWELAERDRVLRAWAGELRPVPIVHDLASPSYEWSAYAFPAGEGSFAASVEVVGVFALPMRDDLPVGIGFAGRPQREDALSAAACEAVQQLAFLWGEAVPASADAPPGAMLHLDTFQIPAHRPRLRAWLEGAHTAFASARSSRRGKAPVRFVDLTMAGLGAELRVAKAICADAMPLVFGESPDFAGLPIELRLHPIP